MNFSLSEETTYNISIKVIGVGGGGGNAVNRMIQSGIQGVEFIAMNTDGHILKFNKATYKIQLGGELTKGQGAGGIPDIGKQAAEESKEDIKTALKGANMVFITAGMGGGTGTGAAPVVARIAKELGILTVGIVTKPFTFEGKRKMDIAIDGITELRKYVDSIVVIPNERLKLVSEERITLANAFEIADNVLLQGVQSISELINVPGFINLDFADVSAIMHESGYAHMGVGRASGSDKARLAAEAAIRSPLLETTIDGAKGVLINITASPDIDLPDVELASSMITDAADTNANIVWGAAFDETFNDEIMITVIATGFEEISHDAAPFAFGPDHHSHKPTTETASKDKDSKEKVVTVELQESDPFPGFGDIMTLLNHRSNDDKE
ncbi:MAG: cell division protein FtsZ [Oscillospiraceae bacterium]